MLMAGKIDAGILGNDLPDDPRFKPVIPDAAKPARAGTKATGLLPINHMFVARRRSANSRPDLVREIYRLFQARKEAPVRPTRSDLRPIGIEAIRPSLELVIQLA